MSDYPFNIILQYLTWFEYIWAMLWLRWRDIPCSVYIVCLFNQSVNCIYFFLTRFSFLGLFKKETRSIISIVDQCSVGHPPSFEVTFVVTNAALHCFCKGKCTLLFGHADYFFSLMFSFTVTHIYITDVEILIIATHFHYRSVNCSLSLWWFLLDIN